MQVFLCDTEIWSFVSRHSFQSSFSSYMDILIVIGLVSGPTVASEIFGAYITFYKVFLQNMHKKVICYIFSIKYEPISTKFSPKCCTSSSSHLLHIECDNFNALLDCWSIDCQIKSDWRTQRNPQIFTSFAWIAWLLKHAVVL